ncbi:MAG: hypothetical protein WC466_09865 [Candidatus Izemoplasmatales bacterium]
MNDFQILFRYRFVLFAGLLGVCLFANFFYFKTSFFNLAVLAATNELPNGYLDGANCNNIGGWTCDANDYSAPLEVHFYADAPAGQGGVFIGSTTANITREAAVGAQCGGNAKHGFSFSTPSTIKNGQVRKIYAYAINTPAGANPALINSGSKTVQCDSGIFYTISDHAQVDITFGAEEVVFDYSTSKCETGDIPDISARAFTDSNGKTQLLASHYKSYRMIGDSLASLAKDCTAVMSSDFNSDASKFNDHEWIAAPYTLDGAKVYALMHNEYQGHLYSTSGVCATGQYRDCWYNSITSSISSNNGKTYTHSAAPAHLVLSSPFKYNGSSAGPIGFFEPSNIIKGNDGYYYAFVALSQPTAYNGQTNPQSSGICVMRTGEIKELTGTGTTVWKLWDGTGFNIENKNPYTQTVNPSAQVCQPVNGEYAQLRSVTWNTYLNKYIGAGISYDSSNNKWFTLAFSDNLIDWTVPQKFRAASNTAANNEVYTSIIDPEVIVNNANVQTKNFEKSDSSFYLYFTRINDGNMNRDLIRIPVGILKANQVCAPGAGNGCRVCNSAGSAWVDDNSRCSPDQVCSSGACQSVCVPRTCTGMGYSCGLADSGCGGTLTCGACPSGYACSGNRCVSMCVPKTCTGMGYSCGNQSDGCGGMLNCGTCAPGKACSQGGCVSNCASHAYKKCSDGNLYWYNSCNNKEELAHNCEILKILDYRCNSQTIQKKIITGDCANDTCIVNPVWTDVVDCSVTGEICENGACVVPKIVSLDRICTPEKISGCKVCNAAGTGWINDNLRCAGGETCVNGACVSAAGGAVEPKDSAPATRAEILQKITEIKQLLIQLIAQLIAELQKQLALEQ